MGLVTGITGDTLTNTTVTGLAKNNSPFSFTDSLNRSMASLRVVVGMLVHNVTTGTSGIITIRC
jgi:hypothetical protein